MRVQPFAAFVARIRAARSSSPDATRSVRLKKLHRLPGVSRVIGNSHKHQLAEIVIASRRPEVASVAHIPALFLWQA